MPQDPIAKLALSAFAVAFAILMILIAGDNNNSFLTGFLWIISFLALFLLQKNDAEEDER